MADASRLSAPAAEQTADSVLNESKYEVEVKLGSALNASINELQQDVNNPLYSARTFEELGL